MPPPLHPSRSPAPFPFQQKKLHSGYVRFTDAFNIQLPLRRVCAHSQWVSRTTPRRRFATHETCRRRRRRPSSSPLLLVAVLLLLRLNPPPPLFADAPCTCDVAESNLVDPAARLAHSVVRRPNVHQRRAVRHSAHARLQHVDAANQVCAETRPRHVRVSGE